MGREFHIKRGEKILAIIRKFTATEKVVFAILTILALISAVSLAWRVNLTFLTPIASHGGTIYEGVVGLPRSINPILAVTEVDRDIVSLIYAGLTKYDNDKIVPDLATKYTVTPDGLTYTFTLREDLRFHDGIPLTTDDVEFTVQKVQDGTIKSPRRADWANVTIKKLSSKEIQFTLKQPFSPFITNTTLGIIPKHIWSKVSPDQFIFSQYNIEPIGSGPYRIKRIVRDNGGIPLYYTLTSFSRYHNREAYIADINIYFYSSERAMLDAYTNRTITSIARISPSEASRIASTTPHARVIHTPLPRIFGIFFNQNQAPLFIRPEVRKALNLATDRRAIVKDVLFGYGIESTGPLPTDLSATSSMKRSVSSQDIETAKNILAKAGWVAGSDGILQFTDKKGTITFEFSIATADSPDLKQTATIIKKQWERIGAKVTIKVFEYGDLYQNVITPRKYDALLFGETVSKDIDLYAFWHSSQRNAPGLNVAMYVNSKVDKLLDDARVSLDLKAKNSFYTQFEKIIHDDIPAIFLYSPEFIYIVPDKVLDLDLRYVNSSSDRFYGIEKWYITTDNVWKIFDTQNNTIN